VAIIPLAQPLPIGSSDLPGGFGRAALLTPPYLVLHREEFAWPRMLPSAPVRSYFRDLRSEISNLRSEIWDLGSPCGPHRFTHHLVWIWDLKSEISNQTLAGLFSVALVVTRSSSPISDL